MIPVLLVLKVTLETPAPRVPRGLQGTLEQPVLRVTPAPPDLLVILARERKVLLALLEPLALVVRDLLEPRGLLDPSGLMVPVFLGRASEKLAITI